VITVGTDRSDSPGASTRAGASYALIVFAVGFVLGSFRVLFLAPHLGAMVAVLLETPFMLAASWWVAKWCTGRFRVPAQPRARILMGIVAFCVLMLAEFALGTLAFGNSLSDYLRAIGSAPGAIGFAAQIAFASFPLVQLKCEHPPVVPKSS
jgi:hypothetical protein